MEFPLGEAALGTAIDLSGLKSGIGEAEKQARLGFSKIGDIVGGVLKVGLAAAAGGILAAGAIVGSGIADAREAQKIMAQTEAVIKSTGGAADKSAEQIADLAASLSAASGKSLFGDDDIQKSENLLLTFTNIKGEVFDAATAISVDMAQALGGLPADQAIQLGKALNDPIQGITALTRVGVTFTDQQKEQIKTMQESGDMAGAQKVILAELNKEFGGSAEAAAKADGGWAQFHDRMGEVIETIGAAALPLLDKLAGFLNDTLAPAIESAMPTVERIVGILGELIGALAAGDFGAFAETLQGIGEELGPIFAGLAEQAGAWIADAVPVFLENATQLLGALIGWVEESLPDWIAELGKLAAAAAQWVIDALPGLGEKLGQLYNSLINWVVDSLPNWIAELQKLASAAIQWIQDAMPGLGTNLGKFVGKLLAWIAQTIIDITPKLAELGLKFIVWVATDVIPKLPGALLAIATGIYNFISEVVKEVGPKLIVLATKFITWVETDVLPKLPGVLDNIKTGILDWINGVLKWMGSEAARIGSEIVAGIKQGIINAWGSFTSWLIGQAQSIIDNFLQQYGITSPSRVFAEEVGEPIVLGILQGIESMWPDLLARAGEMSDDLVKEVAKMAEKVNEAIASAFDATASIERQKAKMLDKVADYTGTLRDQVEKDLGAAADAAAKMQDPEEAAAFFQMRSRQITELADLQAKRMADLDVSQRSNYESQLEQIQHILEAEELGAEQKAQLEEQAAGLQEQLNADLSEDERARLDAQIAAIERAQIAERAAFDQRQQNMSQTEQFAEDIQDLIDDIAKDTAQTGASPDLVAVVDQLSRWLAEITGSPAPGTSAPPPGSPSFPGGPVTLPEPAPMPGSAGAGGGQTMVFHIDARGATMRTSEYEAITRRVMDAATRRADARRRSGG